MQLSKHSDTKEFKNKAMNAMQKFKDNIEELIDKGNKGISADFEDFINDLSQKTSIDREIIHYFIQSAKEKIKSSDLEFDRNLREIAQKYNCSFDSKSPYFTFGCVTLKRGEENSWSLSILDTNIPLLRFNTYRAEEVAQKCLTEIKKIENSLNQSESTVKSIKEAYNMILNLSSAQFQNGVPVTLLMLLSSSSPNKDIKKLLKAASDIECYSVFSRSTFGYLLAKISKNKKQYFSYIKGELQLIPATQNETKDYANYIAVPNDYNPRNKTEYRLISKVKIHKE